MIYIGADHGGFKLKELIKSWLIEMEIDYQDVGAFEFVEDDDFVDFAKNVVDNIKNSEDRGILICRSGVGVDIVANRFKHIRCGLGINVDQVEAGRRDDDINVLALAADFYDEREFKNILTAFLKTEFSNEERYVRRLNKIKEQIASIDSKGDTRALDSNIALQEFMFGEKGNTVAKAESKSATYSTAPTKYNVDPYREVEA